MTEMTEHVDGQLDLLSGPGQARVSDPPTSHEAAKLVTARATTARVLLLKAHGQHRLGLTDEEAAVMAGLSLMSEYATRCSELMRAGVLVDTTKTREGSSGAKRVVRQITQMGVRVLEARNS